MSYRQLTLDERYQIQSLVKLKWTTAEIAHHLGRHRSTVLRELRRNSAEGDGGDGEYVAERAQAKSRQRRIDKGATQRRLQGEFGQLVEDKLRLSWSPEQISGRLLAERGIRISHETIYQHVIRDAREHRGNLRYCLRFGGYKQHRLRRSKHAARTRARKNWLDQRPAAANERLEIGHWERDCMLGTAGHAALLTIIDRRSRYTRIRRVAKVRTDEVADATMAALRPHASVTKTVTNDNGTEFQRDDALQDQLGVPIYFCDPSSPWQRGSIENLNGLLRQYLPKGVNLDGLPAWVPAALEETLNFRPRKILGFRTPHEVFFDEVIKLMDKRVPHFGLEFSGPT